MQLQHQALLAALAGSVSAHIHMTEPASLTSKENPNTSEANTDYSINNPLSGMAQYPCKGALKLMGTPDGKSVATYKKGQSYKATIGTGATHNGGSCQFSLSYDKGKTSKVIQSIIGGCPTQNGQFPFTIPADAPDGEAALLWSWINHTGNREFYQDCAVVTIQGGGGGYPAAKTPFDQLPETFVANLGGEYCVAEGTDVAYPEPGPNVIHNTPGGPPTKCGSGEPAPGGAGGGSSYASSPTSAAPAAPSGGVYMTDSPAASPSSAAGGYPAGGAAPAPTSSAAAGGSGSYPGAGSDSGSGSGGYPAASSSSSAAGAYPTGGSSSGGSEKKGACQQEGQWNCIGGSSYQRCASGQWSAVSQMAAGQKCVDGEAATLKMAVRGIAERRRAAIAAAAHL